MRPGYDPRVPYQDLPLMPPSEPLESARVLKAAIEARTRLESLRGLCRLIPNPDLVLQAVTLQEARLSSEIENIVTTNDELYRADEAMKTAPVSPQAKEVARYRQAVWEGFRLTRTEGQPLNAAALSRIATIINGSETSVRSQPGTRIGNPRTGDIVYSPPEGRERILSLLDNLGEFIYAQDDLDPLVRMAAAHYQFEAIHPFRDGNGRTGRILNILLMTEQGLLDLPILYLSKAIIESKAAYYEGLRAVTERGEWEPWLIFMLRAVASSARETSETVDAVRLLMDSTRERLRRILPKIYSHELLITLFAKPYIRISDLERSGVAKRQTGGKYLRELAEAGFLEPRPQGTSMLYLHRPLFEIVSLGRP
jgi:Fic family protein